MQTKHMVVAVGASLAFGATIGALYLGNGDTAEQADNAALYFDDDASTAERIARLEQIVAQERDARMVLEDQITLLHNELMELEEQGLPAQNRDAAAAALAAEAQANAVSRDSPRVRQGSANFREQSITRLEEGGFAPDRAEWLVTRTAQLQYEAQVAAYEARQSGQPFSFRSPENNPSALLRQEVGDQEYEQYLQATGQSTAVSVRRVNEASPASQAGLQPGDEIVAYNGARVFNVFELQSQTNSSAPGRNVVVDVVRDGAPIQVVVPSGPIGIEVGRGFRRPRN